MIDWVDESKEDNAEFFSGVPFSSLNLSGRRDGKGRDVEKTQEVLDRMKFKTMTPIQAKAIPALLSGKDVLGAAK